MLFFTEDTYSATKVNRVANFSHSNGKRVIETGPFDTSTAVGVNEESVLFEIRPEFLPNSKTFSFYAKLGPSLNSTGLFEIHSNTGQYQCLFCAAIQLINQVHHFHLEWRKMSDFESLTFEIDLSETKYHFFAISFDEISL